MKFDLIKTNGQLPEKADICIIGAGPAGLTLAHELSKSKLKIVVLESGGDSPDPKSDALSKGQLSGVLDQELHHVHARQVGGTANHWILRMADKRNGYRYAPLDEDDFEQRDHIPFSGWPISRDDLNPYYQRVHETCDVGPLDYSSEYWEEEGAQALRDVDGVFESGIFSFGATQYFTHDWPKEFETSASVDVYTHATVVELLTTPDGKQVCGAKVRLPDGKDMVFEADQFVIASGGLDTARLLLMSREHTPQGLGNQNDVVGRYYMDHSLVLNGYFYPESPDFMRRLAFYDMNLIEGYSVLGKLSLSKNTRREHKLRHAGFMLFPKPRDVDQRAFDSLQQITWAVHDRRWPEELLKKAWNMFLGSRYLAHVFYQRFKNGDPLMPGLGQGGWAKLDNLEKRFQRMELMTLTEMSPNPENRLTLIDEQDPLGCPKIKLHMEWSQDDLDSIRRSERLMVAGLEKQGLGTFVPHNKDGSIAFYSRTAHHIMGTARMSDDPSFGVVDRHCKVHGVENLHIASSAVFATGGYANPTLTILALAIRLADRLVSKASQQQELASKPLEGRTCEVS